MKFISSEFIDSGIIISLRQEDNNVVLCYDDIIVGYFKNGKFCATFVTGIEGEHLKNKGVYLVKRQNGLFEILLEGEII